MKLNNPYLHTSFSIINCFDDYKTVHVYQLKVICDYCDFSENYFYHIFCLTYEDSKLYLDLYFDNPEDAFMIADKICSLYPPISYDGYSHHFDSYPKYHQEVVKIIKSSIKKENH